MNIHFWLFPFLFQTWMSCPYFLPFALCLLVFFATNELHLDLFAEHTLTHVCFSGLSCWHLPGMPVQRIRCFA
ncbi:hypothetical protein BDY21DRAFT_331127 [Lineolata rhizophorae]|uniref:Uncharacterized protein n=1 Tax=Lineolata rhizophorae TaxID=578093 RepID=A0A6A6PED0_9PEZI|nr:hypothetical protein BDY21DRAFT_331127 [Lineolata rhizophorae]